MQMCNRTAVPIAAPTAQASLFAKASTPLASARPLSVRRSRGAAQILAAAVKEPTKKKQVPLKLEEGDLPLNTYSPKKPFKGKVVSVKKLVGPKATGETCDIVIQTNGEIPYWEGQSYGVVPPVRPPPPFSLARLCEVPI